MAVVPGLYPEATHRPTRSVAESLVHEALRKHLPGGWYAWHSVRVRGPDRVPAEGDFVVADPRRGLLSVEVKGGKIEQRDGLWWQNSRPMDRPPAEQALRFQRILLIRLRERGCRPPAWGVATCFPEMEFDSPPSQDDLAEITIGRRDLRWLDERLVGLMRGLPEARPAAGNWIEALHQLWGETWPRSLTLGRRARLDEDRRVRLDEEQARFVEAIRENSRVLITGQAGSGKTLLAREAAIRMANSGDRVLVLCFTDALANWLRHSIEDPRVRVATVRKFARELLGRAGRDQGDERDPAMWERISLRAADREVVKLARGWDAVILDEAQDLTDGDWLFVLELAGGTRLWAFYDPAQRFKGSEVPVDEFPARLRLPISHRCPGGIIALANRYARRTGEEAAIREAVEDHTLSIIACPTASSVRDKIGHELSRLRAEGLREGDIAIVSVRG